MCLFLSDDGNGVGYDDPANFDDDGDDFGGVDEGLDLGSAEVLEPMGKNLFFLLQYLQNKKWNKTTDSILLCLQNPNISINSPLPPL